MENRFSPDIQERMRSIIDPATQVLLSKKTNSASRTLEIGCGPGQSRLAVNGGYIGMDLTAADYKEGLPRTPDVLADAMALPFPNNVFDFVFYSNIFYQFDDSHCALSEVIRILRPNGSILIFDYSLKTLFRVRDLYARHCPEWQVHLRNCGEWIMLLNEAGFINVKLQKRSLSLKQKLLDLLQCRWTQSLYFSIIDRFEGNILVEGMKPAYPAGDERE